MFQGPYYHLVSKATKALCLRNNQLHEKVLSRTKFTNSKTKLRRTTKKTTFTLKRTLQRKTTINRCSTQPKKEPHPQGGLLTHPEQPSVTKPYKALTRKENILHKVSTRQTTTFFRYPTHLTKTKRTKVTPTNKSTTSIFQRNRSYTQEHLFPSIRDLSFFLRKNSMTCTTLFTTSRTNTIYKRTKTNTNLFPKTSSFFHLSTSISTIPPLSNFKTNNNLNTDESSR